MTKRIQQVNQLIKKEISVIFLREVVFPEGTLVTVTRVETADNLAQSRIFISSIPENKIKEVLQILNKEIYQLQQKLNQRLNMRPVPRICFVEEKETLEAGRIEEILANLKKNEK